jgi:hypothetical protein
MTIKSEKELLSKKICELPLKIEGTPVARLVSRLYRELARAGISLRPKTYLSDGWGCPNRVPVIGIPFYLADRKLRDLRSRLVGIESENNAEAMMVLRHEAGHAFNYAYRLYRSPKWRELFGRFSRPYKEHYPIVPFSPRFVRHVPGWYVQRHPDDDFAETFAVWLTPGSDWRKQYENTAALGKLLFVDEMAKKLGGKAPDVNEGKLDVPVAAMTMTLGTWFRKQKKRHRIFLHPIVNEDLKRLLPAREGEPAADLLRAHRQRLVRDVCFWTGIERETLIALIDVLQRRLQVLELKMETDQTAIFPGKISVFITTLVMNYLYTGKFTGN